MVRNLTCFVILTTFPAVLRSNSTVVVPTTVHERSVSVIISFVLIFCILSAWNVNHHDDYGSVGSVDALFLVAGDPASEDEPMRKGTCLWVSPICNSEFMVSFVLRSYEI